MLPPRIAPFPPPRPLPLPRPLLPPRPSMPRRPLGMTPLSFPAWLFFAWWDPWWMPSPPCLRWLSPPAPSVPWVIMGVETCRIPLRLVRGDSSTSRDGDASTVSESLELPPLASTARRPLAGGLVLPPGKIRVSVKSVGGRTLCWDAGRGGGRGHC